MTLTSHSVTQMLLDWSEGDREALDKLIPIVYSDLRLRAARYLRRERPGHTLQTSSADPRNIPATGGAKGRKVAEPCTFLRHRRTVDAQDFGRPCASTRCC